MSAARIGKRAVKAPKLTDWFGGDVKPARAGVYERKIRGISETTFSRWDGGCWLCYTKRIYEAATQYVSSDYQHSPWRGLAADPSGVVK